VLRIGDLSFGRRHLLASVGSAATSLASLLASPTNALGAIALTPTRSTAALRVRHVAPRRLQTNESDAANSDDVEIAPGVTVYMLRAGIAASLEGVGVDEVLISVDSSTGLVDVSVAETSEVTVEEIMTVVSQPEFLTNLATLTQIESLEYEEPPAIVIEEVDAPPPPPTPSPPELLTGTGGSALTSTNLGALGDMPLWLMVSMAAGLVVVVGTCVCLYMCCCAKKRGGSGARGGAGTGSLGNGKASIQLRGRRNSNAIDPMAMGAAPRSGKVVRKAGSSGGLFGSLFGPGRVSIRRSSRAPSQAAEAYMSAKSRKDTRDVWTPRDRGKSTGQGSIDGTNAAGRARGLSAAVCGMNPRTRKLSSVALDDEGLRDPSVPAGVPKLVLDRTNLSASSGGSLDSPSPRLETPKLMGGVELGGEGPGSGADSSDASSSRGGLERLRVPPAPMGIQRSHTGKLRMPGEDRSIVGGGGSGYGGSGCYGSGSRSGKLDGGFSRVGGMGGGFGGEKQSKAAKLAAWRDLETSRNRGRTRGDSTVGAGIEIDDEGGGSQKRRDSAAFGRFAVRRPSRARAETPGSPALEIQPSGPLSRKKSAAPPPEYESALSRLKLSKSKSSGVRFVESGKERGESSGSGTPRSGSSTPRHTSLERSGDSSSSLYEQAGGYMCSSKI